VDREADAVSIASPGFMTGRESIFLADDARESESSDQENVLPRVGPAEAGRYVARLES
jgi:hypothetical protein